jgi:hypothetical protein
MLVRPDGAVLNKQQVLPLRIAHTFDSSLFMHDPARSLSKYQSR